MNNDLISREALKEQFNGVPDSEDKDIALMLIDNAPSVTSYTLEDLEKAKNNGYKWGKIDGKKERMQGDIIVAGKCPIEADGNCPLKTQGEWVRKEDVIHLLERWADGYSYIEIPTDTAIKAIKEMKGGAENGENDTN